MGVLKIGCPYWKIYNPTDIMMHYVNLNMDFCKVSTTFSQIHYKNTEYNNAVFVLFNLVNQALFHGNNYDFCLHLFITFVRRTLMQAVQRTMSAFNNFCPVLGEFLTWSFHQNVPCAVCRAKWEMSLKLHGVSEKKNACYKNC